MLDHMLESFPTIHPPFARREKLPISRGPRMFRKCQDDVIHQPAITYLDSDFLKQFFRLEDFSYIASLSGFVGKRLRRITPFVGNNVAHELNHALQINNARSLWCRTAIVAGLDLPMGFREILQPGVLKT